MTSKPADYADYMTALAAKLRKPGRMAEFMKTFNSPADADAQLPTVKCPALLIMATLDPDFADPQAEGDAVVAAMPAGRARSRWSTAPGTTRTRSPPTRRPN